MKFGGAKNEQGRMDFRADLARVRCPVLILSGDRDPMSPPSFNETMAKCLPPHLVRHRALRELRARRVQRRSRARVRVLREFILA